MGEELADFMGLSTMTREFMDTDEGLAIMRANQENVRANAPALYTAFLDSILRWGCRLPGQEGEVSWTERIRGVACPTLVLTGDNDYFIPAKFSRIIADAIPGAAYREIPGGGHIRSSRSPLRPRRPWPTSSPAWAEPPNPHPEQAPPGFVRDRLRAATRDAAQHRFCPGQRGATGSGPCRFRGCHSRAQAAGAGELGCRQAPFDAGASLAGDLAHFRARRRPAGTAASAYHLRALDQIPRHPPGGLVHEPDHRLGVAVALFRGAAIPMSRPARDPPRRRHRRGTCSPA